MKRFHVAGSRVIKTGIAIFITAWLCEWLGWPPVFAVITAIVTIEPTVSDSIKKGFIRFPASAIGSFYAVLFISFFDHSPLTYTLAAVCTITTCVKLRLHAGLLVATLTAVAMVEVIHSNYIISFFIRLGTTTIGLIVSTAVNMFLFPPDYTKNIVENINSMAQKTGKTVENVFRYVLEARDREAKDNPGEEMMEQLHKAFHQTETLIQFQKDEAKYHPLTGREKRLFELVQDQLTRLRMIHYHVDNIVKIPMETLSWSAEERSTVMGAVLKLAAELQSDSAYDRSLHQKQLSHLMELFWEGNEEITKNSDQHPTHFPPELIILYELLAIYEQVEAFYEHHP
ncbi:Uncharacterized membrane protein YgaE, UPF0421/DUF939 family [Alteribacillus persepolensis]|uniref:Uncharacterized membrane protein YgaE, UPF0421/DUF939 family n=1 Tax=Alteribacillus persepolensis TaxID=568899 RepID=A0A1G8E0M9_9BACI|nr:aromatic acid exporter family protein [Alteribacillus persepolensis]SDH63428.1 Uncharacterized membrane protein YgaE, UPF0421/DUF939 family [Alteribacillus persepolensis]